MSFSGCGAENIPSHRNGSNIQAGTSAAKRAVIESRNLRSRIHHRLQLRELREYIACREWDPAGEYVDAGVSGAKASRPALDRLMDAASRHEFDCVLVWKLDRFGTSEQEKETLRKDFAALDEQLRMAFEKFADVSGFLSIIGETAADKALDDYYEAANKWYETNSQ